MGKANKVTFSAGYDSETGKYKRQKAEVIDYLLDGMVRVRCKDGTEKVLYKSEYNDKSNKKPAAPAQG